MTDILVADVSWLFNWSDNFVADASDTANYDSTGWTAAANLTAYFYYGNWRISPAVGINYSENNDEAYVDSAGTRFFSLFEPFRKPLRRTART